jgi:hypothetical protein
MTWKATVKCDAEKAEEGGERAEGINESETGKGTKPREER